jgi:hypothetical protein
MSEAAKVEHEGDMEMRSGWKRAFNARLGSGLAVAFMLTAGAAASATAQERLE